MFSVLHGVVIRPLPYPRADRVVRLFPVVREAPFGLMTDLDGTISVLTGTPAEAVVSRRADAYLYDSER